MKVIRHVYGGYSLWYAYLPNIVRSTFEIEFMDVAGDILKKYDAIVDSNSVTDLRPAVGSSAIMRNNNK